MASPQVVLITGASTGFGRLFAETLARHGYIVYATMRDPAVRDADLPPTSREDWATATRGKFYRPVKQQLTVRIDADILEWLKSYGKGYQSRLNAILRAAMLARPRRHGR